MLVFHSWIAEYATVSNVTGNRVYFKEPLKHAPVGTYVPSSGWRFLIFNNVALLDVPGEYVCNDLGDGLAQFSYIPLEEQGGYSIDARVITIAPSLAMFGVFVQLIFGLHCSTG